MEYEGKLRLLEIAQVPKDYVSIAVTSQPCADVKLNCFTCLLLCEFKTNILNIFLFFSKITVLYITTHLGIGIVNRKS